MPCLLVSYASSKIAGAPSVMQSFRQLGKNKPQRILRRQRPHSLATQFLLHSHRSCPGSPRCCGQPRLWCWRLPVSLAVRAGIEHRDAVRRRLSEPPDGCSLYVAGPSLLPKW